MILMPAFSALSLASLLLFVSAFLLLIGIQGSLSAYIKSWVGDDTALQEGFDSCNPFVHMHPLAVLLFLVFRFLFCNRQPFAWVWADGWRGIFQRLFFVLGVTFFHLVSAASVLLSSGTSDMADSSIANGSES